MGSNLSATRSNRVASTETEVQRQGFPYVQLMIFMIGAILVAVGFATKFHQTILSVTGFVLLAYSAVDLLFRKISAVKRERSNRRRNAASSNGIDIRVCTVAGQNTPPGRLPATPQPRYGQSNTSPPPPPYTREDASPPSYDDATKGEIEIIVRDKSP